MDERVIDGATGATLRTGPVGGLPVGGSVDGDGDDVADITPFGDGAYDLTVVDGLTGTALWRARLRPRAAEALNFDVQGADVDGDGRGDVIVDVDGEAAQTRTDVRSSTVGGIPRNSDSTVLSATDGRVRWATDPPRLPPAPAPTRRRGAVTATAPYRWTGTRAVGLATSGCTGDVEAVYFTSPEAEYRWTVTRRWSPGPRSARMTPDGRSGCRRSRRARRGLLRCRPRRRAACCRPRCRAAGRSRRSSRASWALQRQAGNRAVTSLLAGQRPVVQRRDPPTTGEGHDLTSPLLHGDPQLEAIKEGQGVLRPGAIGAHVTKVQQALAAVGHPSTDPPARYGVATSTAVRSFQRAAGMGFAEQDGIVGKRTLTILDQAQGRGPVTPDPDAEANDTTIVAKHPGPDPKRAFFALASAELDAEERAKVVAFAGQHATSPLWLTGLASEEGPESGNADLAARRLAAVEAAVAPVHTGPREGAAKPELGRGSPRYRQMRAVQIDVEAPRDPPSCAEGTPTEGPCEPSRRAALDGIRGQAGSILDTAGAALTGDRTRPEAARADALLDDLYGTTDADRATVRGQVAGQVASVRATVGDGSRFLCANSCDPGHGSGHTAVEHGGHMTFYDKFFAEQVTPAAVRAAIVIHEGHHASLKGEDADGGALSTDTAYNYGRLLGHLRADQALRNASSFHGLVIHTARPAGMPLNTDQTRITPEHADQMDTLPAAARDGFQRSLGWIETWVGTTDFMLASYYRRGSQAHDRGRWRIPEDEYPLWFWGDFLRPRFGLQAGHGQPPTAPDLQTVAAVNDRITTMKRTLNQALTLRHTPGSPPSWERGPGATITVSDAMVGADDDVRTSMLMDELVRATPDISARWHVEYTALIRFLRTSRDRLGPES